MTKPVNTFELKVGDLVRVHGATFRLTERFYHENHTPQSGPVVRFHTELVEKSEYCSIPDHWINRPGGWVIQGNHFAHWPVVDA